MYRKMGRPFHSYSYGSPTIKLQLKIMYLNYIFETYLTSAYEIPNLELGA
jgi:hypothetical protein